MDQMQNENRSIIEETKGVYGKINSYKDLLVWQRSMDLVKHIYSLTSDLPENEKFGLSIQMRKASVSIPSNIAEGWGIAVTGNYIHHLKISYGSLCELETQMILIENLNFVTSEKLSEPKTILLEVSKMLKSLIFTLEQKRNN